MNTPVNVGLVEDQLLFREGMKAIVDSWPDTAIVFESADGYSVIEKLEYCDPLPDVILVDLSLPPNGNREFSGVEVTDALRAAYPQIGIIILSIHEDENFIAQLIEHGAHGYLIKDSDPQEVHTAILAVHEKGCYVNERTLSAIQRSIGKKMKNKPLSHPSIQFTRRELEVLDLICRQMTSEEMGEKLFISIKTVNGHRNNLLQKTGARNTAGLVVYALKHNLVEPVFFD